MHDIRAIRHDPDAFDAACKRRGLEAVSKPLLALDEKLRGYVAERQEAETARNAKSKEIGQAMGAGETDRAEALKAEVAALKERMAEIERREDAVRADLDALLMGIPNLLDAAVPNGADEHDNVEATRWGEPRAFDFPPKDHVDVGTPLGLDLDMAVRLSGARFALSKGQIARLERGLAQFMLDLHTSAHGYVEVSPPVIVNTEILEGTGQLPKFRDDQFGVSTGQWLIPTAEVPLTNMVRETILDEEDELARPMRLTAFTPCFRAEAGSAGRDTRGLIRLHQFPKVELVTICRPEDSDEEHLFMRSCAEKVLELLELPYRVMDLCAGDIGFGAARTFDLEVWLPSQDAYREISSVSNCREFQARRMNATCRKKGEKGRGRFVHTLNGSGVAVGRALVAVLENHQERDGSVRLPEPLIPYMAGRAVLEPEA